MSYSGRLQTTVFLAELDWNDLSIPSRARRCDWEAWFSTSIATWMSFGTPAVHVEICSDRKESTSQESLSSRRKSSYPPLFNSSLVAGYCSMRTVRSFGVREDVVWEHMRAVALFGLFITSIWRYLAEDAQSETRGSSQADLSLKTFSSILQVCHGSWKAIRFIVCRNNWIHSY